MYAKIWYFVNYEEANKNVLGSNFVNIEHNMDKTYTYDL